MNNTLLYIFPPLQNKNKVDPSKTIELRGNKYKRITALVHYKNLHNKNLKPWHSESKILLYYTGCLT